MWSCRQNTAEQCSHPMTMQCILVQVLFTMWPGICITIQCSWFSELKYNVIKSQTNCKHCSSMQFKESYNVTKVLQCVLLQFIRPPKRKLHIAMYYNAKPVTECWHSVNTSPYSSTSDSSSVECNATVQCNRRSVYDQSVVEFMLWWHTQLHRVKNHFSLKKTKSKFILFSFVICLCLR